MPEFVDGPRAVVKRNHANLLNVTIRTVHKDTISALPYAKQDVFGFVLYFNVKFNDADNEILEKTTSELIDVVRKAQGTYYLPYQPFHTHGQLQKSYPEFDEFFATKKKYDRSGCSRTSFTKSMECKCAARKPREPEVVAYYPSGHSEYSVCKLLTN
jgi:hypothetical protein